MSLDVETRMRRFCFLGCVEPVYTYLKKEIDMKSALQTVFEICEQIEPLKFVQVLKEVLLVEYLVRRDESMLCLAAYFASKVDLPQKTMVRKSFNDLIKNDDDLFLFVKYCFLIRKQQGLKGLSKTVRKIIVTWYGVQSPAEVRQMWLRHRGNHSISHKLLIQLSHFDYKQCGDGNAFERFFQTCSQILKNRQTRLVSQSAEATTANDLYEDISLLRTTPNADEALHIVRKHKLHHSVVPQSFWTNAQILEAIIPTMSPLEVLKHWKLFYRQNLLEASRVMQVCRRVLDDKSKLQESNMHPLVLLLLLHELGWCGNMSMQSRRQVDNIKFNYLSKFYERSYGANQSSGLRMHITINLQDFYLRKHLKNWRKLSYVDAAVALAFGFFKVESLVDVFSWTSDRNVLQRIAWSKDMDIKLANNCCRSIKNAKNAQRLALPIFEALKSQQTYDVFVVIVPKCGRGNPHNSSEFLAKILNRYQTRQDVKTKFIIVNLMKFKPSIRYSRTSSEHILEICGIDEHTPYIINNFALHVFE